MQKWAWFEGNVRVVKKIACTSCAAIFWPLQPYICSYAYENVLNTSQGASPFTLDCMLLHTSGYSNLVTYLKCHTSSWFRVTLKEELTGRIKFSSLFPPEDVSITSLFDRKSIKKLTVFDHSNIYRCSASSQPIFCFHSRWTVFPCISCRLDCRVCIAWCSTYALSMTWRTCRRGQISGHTAPAVEAGGGLPTMYM